MVIALQGGACRAADNVQIRDVAFQGLQVAGHAAVHIGDLPHLPIEVALMDLVRHVPVKFKQKLEKGGPGSGPAHVVFGAPQLVNGPVAGWIVVNDGALAAILAGAAGETQREQGRDDGAGKYVAHWFSPKGNGSYTGQEKPSGTPSL